MTENDIQRAALGVIPGVPDVIAIKSGQVYALELKTERGKYRESQVRTMQRMQAAGAIVAGAAGLDEALAKLEEWNLLVGKSA